MAVNAALMRPELVDRVVADSFDGRTLHDGFSNELVNERSFAKGDKSSREFYRWCQGEDWESIVDKDTQALIACAEQKLPLFCKELKYLKSPLLLLASREDDVIRMDFHKEYQSISREVLKCQIYVFKKGRHPAVLSNGETAAKVIKEFIS